jgi:ATP-binding cassette, subfamily B (MDR/TAP), member 1
LQAFTLALSASAKIYETIDRVPTIDIYDGGGDRPKQVDGNLEFRNINFIYPSRPEVQVLENVNLYIPHGKTTALVGASGSGKSTIVGLAERWYDPVEGQVLLDGRDLKDLNLRWLRNQISLVSQEPTLFNATIFENVCHGLIGSQWENATEEEKRRLVQEACISANADNFIQSLPDKYDTVVGERAVLLSGGQKQRIAIARAVVSDPKILLLDEATSALDSQAEGIVQNALDKAAMNRTTIVIAHRLSTIKNADNIVVMAKGKIIEQGTHSELLALDNAYAKFVTAQALATKTIKAEANNEIESEDVDSGVPSFDEKDDIVPNLNKIKSGRSVASQELDRQDATRKGERNYSLFECIKRVFYLEKDMWHLLGIAWIACIVGGGVYPAQAVVFAYLIDTFSLTGQKLQDRANFWSLMYSFFCHILISGSLSLLSPLALRIGSSDIYSPGLRND